MVKSVAKSWLPNPGMMTIRRARRPAACGADRLETGLGLIKTLVLWQPRGQTRPPPATAAQPTDHCRPAGGLRALSLWCHAVVACCHWDPSALWVEPLYLGRHVGHAHIEWIFLSRSAQPARFCILLPSALMRFSYFACLLAPFPVRSRRGTRCDLAWLLALTWMHTPGPWHFETWRSRGSLICISPHLLTSITHNHNDPPHTDRVNNIGIINL